MRKWLPLLLALMLCLVCTAAMAECEHVSQPGNDKLVANTDGTHSHVCTICGTDNGKEECADSCDDDDTACDWCGSTAGEADNYHFDDPTCEVVDGKHVVTCGCGVVVGTYEPRAIDNGDKLFHDMGCWYCFGANGEPEFHTGLGEGTYIDEETCSFTCEDCGFTHEGSHYAAMGGGDGFHGTSCYFCGEWTWKEDCYEECYNSDGECDVCGAPVAADQVRHDYYDLTPCVVSDGKHVRTCISCKEATLELDLIYKEYDEMLHVQGCHYCVRNGLASAEQIPHTGLGSGTNNGDGTCSFTCVDCGYTHEGKHAGGMGIGDGFHGECCNICSAWVWKEDCSEKCTDQDGECDTCGSSDLTVIHGETTSTISGDKCNHVCNDCGETLESYDLDWIPEETRPSGMTGHFSECPECGKTGAGEVPHTYKYTTTADTHTAECTVCGWAEEAAAHTIESGICSVCGYSNECAHEKCSYVPDEYGGHMYICDACGEITDAAAHEYKYVFKDADGHIPTCTVCGYEDASSPHVMIACTVNGANHDVICTDCNGKVATAPVKGYANSWMKHELRCEYCLKQANPPLKTEDCTPVGVYVDENSCTYICSVCNQDWAGGGHSIQAVDNGDGTHDITCQYCGYNTCDDEGCFESSCAQADGKCDVCGSASPADVYHSAGDCIPNGDGTHSIFCDDCGIDLNGGPQKCFDLCTDADGKCDFCGTEGAPIKHYYNENYVCEDCGHVSCPHETLTCSGTGDVHTATCVACGTVVGEYPVETSPWTWLEHGTGCGICALNGTMVTEPCTITNKSTADVCSYVCTVCNYDWSTWNDGKHSFDGYTSTNSDHTTKCITCGYAVTEAHVYTDDKDNDCDVCGKIKQCQHSYWYKVPKKATCTEDGLRVNYCNDCGKEHGTQVIPAMGHDLSTQDMGDYILESCSRCDYENKIEKAPAEEVPAVEAPAEEVPAEEAPVADGLQIAEADETVTLPETVTAAKTFTVTLMKEGQAVQPEAPTTVTLTLTEEELTAINGLKLVLVQADGTLVEIPYEVIDGQIVFTAETLGVFAFVAK